MMMIDDDMHLARRAAKTEFSTVMTAKRRIAGVWGMVILSLSPLFRSCFLFAPPPPSPQPGALHACTSRGKNKLLQ